MATPYLSFVDSASGAKHSLLVPRMASWLPDVDEIGAQEVALGTGDLYLMSFRTDYYVAFTLPNMSGKDVEWFLRLKRHLISGGKVTVGTADSINRTYTGLGMWPGRPPTLEYSDVEALEYSVKVYLRGGTPLLCNYDDNGVNVTLLANVVPGDGTPYQVARASQATYIDASGVLQTANANVVRDGHYIGSTRTILIEHAATNALTWTEDWTNAAWTKTNITTSGPGASAGVAATAYKIQETATVTVEHRLERASPAFTANTYQALSVYVKAAERSKGWFFLQGGVGNGDWIGCSFDLGAGTIATYSGGNGIGNVLYTRIEALGTTGWYRIMFVGKLNTTSTGGQLVLRIDNGGGTPAYTGVAGSGFWAWGMQFETGSMFVTSYCGTAGAATVTRQADNMWVQFASLPQQLSVYAKFIDLGLRYNQTDGGRSPRVWQIGRNDDGGYRFLTYAPQGGAGISSWIGDSVVNSTTFIAHGHNVGDTLELLTTLDKDSRMVTSKAVNGVGAGSSGPTFAAPWQGAFSDTRLYLGNLNGQGASAIAIVALKVATGVEDLPTMQAA